jgi:hypothetical protein
MKAPRSFETSGTTPPKKVPQHKIHRCENLRFRTWKYNCTLYIYIYSSHPKCHICVTISGFPNWSDHYSAFSSTVLHGTIKNPHILQLGNSVFEITGIPLLLCIIKLVGFCGNSLAHYIKLLTNPSTDTNISPIFRLSKGTLYSTVVESLYCT